MAGLIKRGRIWHMRMQVPKRFSAVEPRREIVRSLKTTDKVEATARLIEANRRIERDLETKLHHDGRTFSCYYGQTDYMDYQLPFRDDLAGKIVCHLQMINSSLGDLPKKIAEALQESSAAARTDVIKPRTMNQLAREMSSIEQLSIRAKSDHQLKKWEDIRVLIARQIEEAVGEDLLVDLFDGAAAHAYVEWLKSKVARGHIKVVTANRQISLASAMIKAHRRDTNQEDQKSPFIGRRLTDRYAANERKKELPEKWITEVLLNESLMSGLNSEARDILLVCLETGCRQLEVTGLPDDAIFLDHEVPHLSIDFKLAGDQRREVKNMHSVRQVPLVGVALNAMRRHPTGFPRYRNNANFTWVAGQYFRRKSLLTPEFSIGGLRHSFEGRLIRAGVPNEVRAELMGHSVRRVRGRERYGDDLSLKIKESYHAKVAFDAPP